MQYIIIGLIILCFFLLYRYIRLRKGLRTLYQQLHYQNLTNSKFQNYMDGKDHDLNLLYEEIQYMRDTQEEEKTQQSQRDRNFRSMITNISHDIRTPLTSINGYLQLLEESHDAQKQRQYIMIIQERSAYLKNLLEELFLYTKIINHGMVYEMEYVQPCELLSHTLLAFYPEFQRQNIKVEVQYEAENAMIFSDACSLERIFTNILNNCLRHGRDICLLHQWIDQDNMMIQIINDVSEAMSEEQIDRLFERFYTKDAARTTGSGLGLAIVKALVEQCSGSVAAAYEHGKLVITLQFQFG